MEHTARAAENGVGVKDHGDAPQTAPSSRSTSPSPPTRPSTGKRGKSKEEMHAEDLQRRLAEAREMSSSKHEPYHVFSKKYTYFIIALATLSASFSALASNVYFPAQSEISRTLNITPETVNLSIVTYLLSQGIMPSIWGPLADVIGRRIVLVITLLIFVVANIALALSQNAAMLLIFRFVQGAGSASAISLGAGVIADIAPPSTRGGYMGVFAGVRQVGMAVGPVIGGILAGALNFRAIFWFLAIFSAIVVVGLLFFLPETLRRIAGNGTVELTKLRYKPWIWLFTKPPSHANFDDAEKGDGHIIRERDVDRPQSSVTWKTLLDPYKFLIEKDVACALFFGSSVYASWSMMIATTTYVLEAAYDFSTIQIALCFLGNGIGCVLGSIVSGKALNVTFRREAGLYHHHVSHQPPETPLPKAPLPADFPLERARLSRSPVYSILTIFGLLIYGWSLTPHFDKWSNPNTAIITPLLAQCIVGFGSTAVLNSNNTLLVDLYPGKSATAAAVSNLARCILATVGVGVVDLLYRAIGIGWLSVVLSGMIVVGFIPYCFHWAWGQKWREERAIRTATNSGVNTPMKRSDFGTPSTRASDSSPSSGKPGSSSETSPHKRSVSPIPEGRVKA